MIKAKTTSFLKANTTASDLDEMFTVGQNGTHNNAIEIYGSERENTLALVQLVNISEKDKTDGLIFSKEQLLP